MDRTHFNLPELLLVKTFGMLVMVTRNFAGIRLRFKDLCLNGSEDFTDRPVVRYLPVGREEGKSFVFDQFALPGTLYPAVSLKLSQNIWEWLRPETSGHFVNVFPVVRSVPCICGTGKILDFLQWVLGSDAERKNLFTLVHWSNSLFS